MRAIVRRGGRWSCFLSSVNNERVLQLSLADWLIGTLISWDDPVWQVLHIEDLSSCSCTAESSSPDPSWQRPQNHRQVVLVLYKMGDMSACLDLAGGVAGTVFELPQRIIINIDRPHKKSTSS